MSAQSAYLILQTYAEDWGDEPTPMIEHGVFLTTEAAEDQISTIILEEREERLKEYREEYEDQIEVVESAQAARDHAEASHKVLLAAGLATPDDALNFPKVPSNIPISFDQWLKQNSSDREYTIQAIPLR